MAPSEAAEKGCRGAVSVCGVWGRRAPGPLQGKAPDELALATVCAVCFACVFCMLCALFFGAPSQHLPVAASLLAVSSGTRLQTARDARRLSQPGRNLRRLVSSWVSFGETLMSRQRTP